MANLGFIGNDNKIFHINQNPNNKRKKDEELLSVPQTVQPTVTMPDLKQPTNMISYQTKEQDKLQSTPIVEQQPKKSNAEYYGLAAKTGLVGGALMLPQASLQEYENALRKGENINTPMEALGQVTQMLQNPISTPNILGTAARSFKTMKEIWTDKNTNALQKLVGTGLEAFDNASRMTGTNMSQYAERSALPLIGAANRGLDESVANLRETIGKPAQDLQQQFAEQSQQRGTGAQMLGQGIQAFTNMIPSMVTTAVTKNPNAGLMLMVNNAKGQATQEALDKGASLDEAIKIGNAKGYIEYMTERISGGLNIFGKGAIDDVVNDAANKYVKNQVLNFFAKQGIGIAGEVAEEITSDLLGTLIDAGTLEPGKKYTLSDLLNTVGPTVISTVLMNLVSGGYGGRAYRANVAEMQEYNNQNTPVSMQEAGQKMTQPMQSIAQTSEAMNLGKTKNDFYGIQNTVQEQVNDRNQYLNNTLQNLNENKGLNPNDKIQAFRDSVAKENVNDAEGFYRAVEKIIQDKDYNVVLDSSIKNAEGKSVNAVISNENGITIKINPKSERAGEILLMHEITHGIETQEMSNLIMDYASKNSEFNDALEDLKKAYGTEDVTPEVVADISGQLFGNQEFINNLSTENPSIFKRIYDAIVSIANRITGNSKEALFVRDLQNKWEKAYRESNIESAQQNLKEGARYSQNAESDINEINNFFNDKGVQTNRTTDNEGRKLSKGQENFFDESKARDENGALVRVYHTVNHPIVQFNEFNPVGTPGYRFGNQVVVYASASKDMSGSYANNDYEMVDTQKLNNIEEVNDWLYEVGLPFFEIENNTVYDEEGAPILKYKTEDQLLRNIKSDIRNEMGDYNKLQYEGYLNIKNPYIVESQGADWDSVEERYDEERAKLYENTIKKRKQQLIDLVSESKAQQKEQYEDKKIRRQIETASDILKNFKNEATSEFFEKLKVGEEIAELHPSLRDAATYDDFLEYVKASNEVGDYINKTKTQLPSSNEKLSNLIKKDTLDFYENNKISPIFNNLKNKTFGEFMKELIGLYTNEGVYGTADRYFWFNMEKVFGDDDVSEIIEPSEWIEVVDKSFSKEAKEAIQKKPLTTNDVVKLILEENKQRPDNEKYDGVIFKKIFDYGGESLNETPEDVYAVFNSNQFKAVDNLNPTSDPDIRYSKKTNKWQDFLEKHFKNEGTTTNLKEKIGKKPKAETKQGVKLKEKNGKYTREDVVKTAEQIRKQFDNQTLTNKKGMKVSNFYSNITEKSQFIEPETRETLKTEKSLKWYKEVTNEQALKEAVDRIGITPSSQARALNEFLTKQEQFTAVDMAEGWVFLKQYQDAGNYDAMASVAKKMREMGTKSGQAIQMLNLEARLTPEGMYRFAVNELAEAEQKFNSEKGRKKSEIEKYRKNFQLTPEETNFIKTQMEKVQKMEPGRARDIEVAKVNSMLQNKIPHTKGQSVKAWMRLSMLFNPKTQVRNVMGNALITPVNALADVAAGLTDKYVANKTGQRTIGAPSLRGAYEYAKRGTKAVGEAWQDYRMGIDTKNVNQNRFDIGQGKAFNEQHTGPLKDVRNYVSKKLNGLNDLLGFVMDAGDRFFLEGSTANSLYNQQRLNNTKEITKDMYDIAEMEGLQRTWNDNNQFTKAVLNIRRAINDIGGLMHIKIGEYGLGDLMIPFAKTPANLTKAIVDYSPVGFLNAITEGKDLKRAIETGNYTPQQQHDFAQTVGKAAAGSLLYALGMALAQAKITTGDSDEDKDLKNFMRYNLGIQPYSIKVGNKSFTYDWAQPIAAPFAITADIEKGINEEMTPAQAIQQFLTTGFNILTEQSFLSGVNEVLNNNDGVLQGIEQQIINMPATAIPTLLKQFTDRIDSTKRQTYSKEGMVENAKKYAQSKALTKSKELAPQVDVLGNEIQKYGGENTIFNVYFNPANTEKGKTSDVSKEIYALYQATGNKNIIPKKVDYSITKDGKKKVLTTEEMAKWQKASGKYVIDNVSKAIKDPKYQRMSDDDKASVINGIVNYSYMKAKSETFDMPISSYYSGPSNAEKKGIPMYDYYISKIKE